MQPLSSSPILHKPKPTRFRVDPTVCQARQVTNFVIAAEFDVRSCSVLVQSRGLMSADAHASGLMESLIGTSFTSDEDARLRELAWVERELCSRSYSSTNIQQPLSSAELLDSQSLTTLRRSCGPTFSIPKRPTNPMVRDPVFHDPAIEHEFELDGGNEHRAKDGTDKGAEPQIEGETLWKFHKGADSRKVLEMSS